MSTVLKTSVTCELFSPSNQLTSSNRLDSGSWGGSKFDSEG